MRLQGKTPANRPAEEQEQHRQPAVLPTDAIPVYKNWFEEGYVTKPIDQHNCGACWAFAAISALESLALIKGAETDGFLQEYSIQQLIDCDKENYGCEGGWMLEGFDYTAKEGIMKNSEY